nr:hypothetical protein OG461_32795 [Streptomyces sp. NBC_00995]
MARLAETYRTATADRAQRDLGEIVEGTDAIRTRHLQLQLSARSTIGRPEDQSAVGQGAQPVAGPLSGQTDRVAQLLVAG